MITGAHSIIYSRKPEADRAFLRDVLRLPYVDAGEGWLIFGLPPADLAVHPSRKNDLHEFYFICEDAKAFVGAMAKRKIRCRPVQNMGWGLLTHSPKPHSERLNDHAHKHHSTSSRAPGHT